MAHRGKFYPVHFRRDFNFNADIRSVTTLPAKWTTTLHSGVVPPYIVDGHTFVLQDIAGPDDHTVAWLSPAQSIGIWLWQVRLLVSWWSLPDADLQSTWFLERDAITVSSWRRIQSNRFDPVTGGNALTWQVLFTDFTTFERGADFNNSITAATGYPP